MNNVEKYYKLETQIEVLSDILTNISVSKEKLWQSMPENDRNIILKKEGVEV